LCYAQTKTTINIYQQGNENLFIDNYEGITGDNVGIIEDYKEMFQSFAPEDLKKRLAGKPGDINGGAKYLVLAALFAIVLVPGMIPYKQYSSLGWGGVALVGITLVIVIPICIVIGELISAVITFIVCKLLGGQGTFANHFYQIAILASGLIMCQVILELIPMGIGQCLFGLVSLYALYPLFLIYKGVHKFDDGKAIAAILIPMILAVLLAIVIYFIAAAFLLTFFGAMTGGALGSAVATK
jgi:hypothetical protein